MFGYLFFVTVFLELWKTNARVKSGDKRRSISVEIKIAQSSDLKTANRSLQSVALTKSIVQIL